MSSASIRSSSELLPEESLPSIFTLPSELEIIARSGAGIVDHNEAEFPMGESLILNCPLLLFGMFIARPVIVGEESGEDCSASVE